MDILMMLILPIHEHGICFHLIVSSLISFFKVVQFSEQRSFTSLVRFIPRYLVLYIMGYILNSVSDILLLGYKMPLISECRLCTLLFCQIHLLDRDIFWWSLQGFLYTLYVIRNDRFTPYFLIWMTFISFSCAITLARTTSTTLNKMLKVEALLLFLILLGNILVFTH